VINDSIYDDPSGSIEDDLKDVVKILNDEIEQYFKMLLKFANDLGILEDHLLKHGASLFESRILEVQKMRDLLHKKIPSDEEYANLIAKKVSDFDILKKGAGSAGLTLPQSSWEGMSMAVFLYKQKRKGVLGLSGIAHGVGLFVGARLGFANPKAKADIISRFAKSGAQAKLKKDPKQAAKLEAKKLWEEWQAGKTKHKGAAAFARFVCGKYPILESTAVVERWVRQWAASKQQK